jgi:hypothetical protein
MEMVRAGLMRTEAKASVKSWRPHLLVLSGAPTRRWSLVEIGSAFTHNRGLLTVATVLPEGSRDAGQRSSMEETILDYLGRRGVQGMARVITAPDPYAGARALVESYGLGPLVPNTVILGASEETEHRDEYCAMVREIHRARRNTVILAENTERGFGERRRIDVWWGGLQDNGGLMLTLAYLLRTSAPWRQAEVRLKLVVPDEAAAESARENLERMVRSLRVGARSEVLVADKPFSITLRESSGDADLIFLGIARPGAGFRASYETVQAWTADLPTTVMVLAGEGLEFSRLLLDGTQTE